MIKIKSLDKYDTLLDVQRSDTLDREYQIRWSKQHGYFCECPGWQTGKKKPKICRHIRIFQFKAMLKHADLNQMLIRRIVNETKQIWKGII